MYKIEELKWDSEHFGKKIGSFQLSSEFVENINCEDYDILISKIDATQKKIIFNLEELGFRLMDTLVTFSIKNIKLKENTENVIIGSEVDLPNVVKIAEKSYRLGHFHSNFEIDSQKADKLYGEWVKNRFFQGEKLYIYKEQEIIKGFLLVKERETEATIDLISVEENFRGEKIGKKLIQNFFNQNLYKKSYVGTQVTNMGAIKLYESMGYKIEKFTHVFHKNI